MAESPTDRKLESLLAYRGLPQPDPFVREVMRGVRRQQTIRRMILLIFGVIGALFGVIGAHLLSGQITRLFTEALTSTIAMQIVLGVVALLAFYTWFMNEDLSLST